MMKRGGKEPPYYNREDITTEDTIILKADLGVQIIGIKTTVITNFKAITDSQITENHLTNLKNNKNHYCFLRSN